MTEEVLRSIFMGAAIAAGVMLIVSIILFIVFKIPRVIGDLSGSTAKKAIESIRSQNASTGNKIYKSSQVNKERGKLTDKISQSGHVVKNPTGMFGGAMGTSKISTQTLNAQANENATTVLVENPMYASEETSVLNTNINNSEKLEYERDKIEETTVITSAPNETTVLTKGMNKKQDVDINQTNLGIVFEIKRDITFIHTNERIS